MIDIQPNISHFGLICIDGLNVLETESVFI